MPPNDPHAAVHDAAATAAALPWAALPDAVEALLRDGDVRVPPRTVLALPAGGSLFVMPASDADVAITKLITFVADNATRGRPTIQGEVVVFDARDGRHRATLDGPTVTARRTAAVSLAAARRLAPRPHGRLAIVGAGVQGRAHLEAFVAGLGTRDVTVASRSAASAHALAAHARTLGCTAEVAADADAAVRDADLVISATPAQHVALHARPHDRAFVAAVGAFTPRMAEWSADAVRHCAAHGRLVVDTRDADHEAGDLLQAGIDVAALPTLADVVRAGMPPPPHPGPVFFKSCGWAGWDLAAARCVLGRAV